MITIAVVLTWTAPIGKPDGVVLTVDTDSARYCGKLVSAADGTVALRAGRTCGSSP